MRAAKRGAVSLLMTILQRAPSLSWNVCSEGDSRRRPLQPMVPEHAPPNAGRIAILFQDFAAGGTERIMIRLANEWAKSREVVILCGSERGPARDRVGTDVTVLQMRQEIARSPLSRVRLGRAIAHMLPLLKPDILVGPGNHVLPVFGAIDDACVPAI
jgi:hypothetical protein